MSTIRLFLLTLLLSVPVRAADTDPDTAAKKLLATNKELVATLKAIKDRASAEKARPALQQFGKDVDTAMRVILKAPPAKAKELEKKYREQLDPLMQQVEKEVVRLEKLPAVRAVLGDTFPLKQRTQVKVQIARAQVRELTTAVQTYYVRQGDWPKDLVSLTKTTADGGGPFLEAKQLTDPWGQPYQYDVNGTKNNGFKPDIWSKGPPGAKERIGNWATDKK